MIPTAPLRDSLSDHEMTSDGGDSRLEPLLVVEDDIAMVRAFECYFASFGLEVVSATTVTAAKRYFNSRASWTMVISDFHLPDGNGWDLCCWVREQAAAATPFLLVSGAAGASSYAGQVNFLAKPFSVRQLDRHVEALLGAGYRRGAVANRMAR